MYKNFLQNLTEQEFWKPVTCSTYDKKLSFLLKCVCDKNDNTASLLSKSVFCIMSVCMCGPDTSELQRYLNAETMRNQTDSSGCCNNSRDTGLQYSEQHNVFLYAGQTQQHQVTYHKQYIHNRTTAQYFITTNTTYSEVKLPKQADKPASYLQCNKQNRLFVNLEWEQVKCKRWINLQNNQSIFKQKQQIAKINNNKITQQ